MEINKDYVERYLTTAILADEPVFKNAALYRIGVYLGLFSVNNYNLTAEQEDLVFETAYRLLDD
jgi:hypothetical protein